MFIGPATPVYEGMIVGENPKQGDIAVNVCKKKQLTADELNIDGVALGKLIALVAVGKVSGANAKRILAALFDGEKDPEAYAKRSGLIIGEGAGDLVKGVIAAVLAPLIQIGLAKLLSRDQKSSPDHSLAA